MVSVPTLSSGPILDIADSLDCTGSIEIANADLVEKAVKLLKDTGANWNMVKPSLVSSLGSNVTLEKLSYPVQLLGVSGPSKKAVTHRVKLPLRLADDTFSEEFFYIGEMAIDQDIILGQPWLWKHQPELMKAFANIGQSPAPREETTSGKTMPPTEPDHASVALMPFAYGPCTNPTIAFSAGGVLAAIDAEQHRRLELTEKANAVERVSIAIAEQLDYRKERSALIASANPEDPGVRGLTGNKEGWLDTIPERFRRFAHTVFSDEAASELPPHRPGMDCEIKIREGERLKTCKVYELNDEQLRTLDALIKEELRKGFIRESKSPSSAPCFFVRDPPSESRNKGQLRMVIDYRDLNSKIIMDDYPLPLTRAILARLPKAKVFTKFDVRSGFSNIRMAPGSEQYTAFKANDKLYEYQVMPMGLATAPAVFQRFINGILSPFLGNCAFAYLDDIIIFSNSEEEHVKHVEQILEVLEKNKLHLKPAKCVWGVPEISFLGFTAVAGKGVRMSDDKVFKIQNLESPRSTSEVREVLGLINFYSMFIPHYSDICACLNALLKKDVKFHWHDEHEKAFRRLLTAVRKDVFLAAFDPALPLTLETDASDVAYGGVISQPGPDGRLRPIIMFHHKFSGHEVNWDIHDKELFAIVYAFDKFRHFLAQPRFTVSVISDHRNLSKFMISTDLLKSHDGRLARWWQTLSEANFRIEYRTGEENVVADFLSRYQQDVPPPTGHVLLPRHRFSQKALADLEKLSFLKKSRDTANIRQKLEDSHFGKKKIGSPLPVEDRPRVTSASARASLSAPARPKTEFLGKLSSFAQRYATKLGPAALSRAAAPYHLSGCQLPSQRHGLGFTEATATETVNPVPAATNTLATANADPCITPVDAPASVKQTPASAAPTVLDSLSPTTPTATPAISNYRPPSVEDCADQA
jgi:hypothetical protein